MDRQLVHLPRKAPFLAPSKTVASNRTIPLPQVVVNALTEHVRQFPSTHPDGLVFTDYDDEALRRTAFSRDVWRATTDKLPAAPATSGMYDLRHYYASLLIRHGESIKTVPLARARHRRGDAGHLLAPLAGLRRPDA